MSNIVSHGKRMVPEYLVKGLEEAYAKTSGGTGSTINLMENIVDSKGNKRFVEGEGTAETITGFTFEYNKWSLSGTHLMVILAGKIDNGTSIVSQKLSTYDIPKYIYDKVTPLISQRVERRNESIYGTDMSTQQLTIELDKENNVLTLNCGVLSPVTADRYFRFQFDIIIDNE